MYAFRREADSPDEMGRTIHLVFTWLAALLAGATAAAESAVAVPTERSTGALPVLLTVPRSPFRLACGFYLSRVFLALTALLAVLPLEGIALLLGGVDGAALFSSLLCILSATVFGAAAGLLAGYDAQNHRVAVGRAALLVLSLTILLPVALAVCGVALHDFRAIPRPPPPDLLHPTLLEEWCYISAIAAFFVNPLGGLFVHSFDVSGVGFPPFTPPWLTVGRIHGVVALYAAFAAYIALRVTGRRLMADTERSTVAAQRVTVLQRLRGWIGRAPARAAEPVWTEPMFWKEARPPRNAWARWSLRLGVVGWMALLGWLWLEPEVRDEMVGPGYRATAFYDVFCAAPVFLFFLATAAACGTLVAEERERNALDLLRAAPIPARAYYLGRFLGTGWRLLPLGAASVLFVVAGVWMGLVHPAGVLCWVLGAALVAPFLSLLAFRVGMAAPTVRAAQRRVGLVMGVFIVGWPFLHWFLEEAVNARDFTHQVVAACNPFISVAGPYLGYARLMIDDDKDLTRMAVAGTLAALVWGLFACVLWRLLPRALDRAFHEADEP